MKLKIRGEYFLNYKNEKIQIIRNWFTRHTHDCVPELENMTFKCHCWDSEPWALPPAMSRVLPLLPGSRIEADPRELWQERTHCPTVDLPYFTKNIRRPFPEIQRECQRCNFFIFNSCIKIIRAANPTSGKSKKTTT